MATIDTETLVLDARAASFAGESRVGGKAMGLARLAETGADVPWWVVLPVDAFEHHVARGGLNARIHEELSGLTRERAEEAGSTLARAVREAPLDAELDAAVRTAIAGRSPLAARSSVVGEDSAAGSHAGLFDSFLFLNDAESVLDAIRGCWASAFNARALVYRLERGELDAPPTVAVVVQEFVEGEVSGVLFTSNPVSGRHDEALVSATWGLGEGIVSGRANADEYVVAHDGTERKATIADKDLEVVSAPGGRGTEDVAVQPVKREARALNARRTGELVRTSVGIAAAFGRPQDIEWTLSGDRLVFLQARPITTMAPPSPLGTNAIVFDNSNIQESFNGVTTPMTFSVMMRAYSSVYEQTLGVIGLSPEQLARNRPVVRNMLALVDRRVYYNINNWYRWLLNLPSFDRNKADMEQMMGLEHPVDFVEGTHLSTLDKLRKTPGMLLTGARLQREFLRIEKSVETFMRRFEADTRAVDRGRLADMPFDALITLSDRLYEDIIDRWVEPILNDIYVMTTAGRLRKLLEGAVGADEARELVTGLMNGEEALASTEPTRRLMTMAGEIRQDPALMQALTSGEPAEAYVRLRERSPRLRAALDEYIELFGDRSMGEMKLETVSLRMDPSFLVRILRNFAERPDLDPEALSHAEQQRVAEFDRQAAERLGPWKTRSLRRSVANARRAVASREEMRLARTRSVGIIRDIVVAAGHRLHEAKVLEDPRDVFFLTLEELVAYRDGTAVTANLAALARLRKEEFASYEGEEPPHHFETFGSPYHGERVAPAEEVVVDGPTLKGLGCSPGVIEGELHVIMSPTDDLSVNGKILTTLRTDPGWAPLFPSAGGLLIERGSILSHSAVLAREFGIPCVVGVPGLLGIVRNGERVRLDGATGIVERLDAS